MQNRHARSALLCEILREVSETPAEPYMSGLLKEIPNALRGGSRDLYCKARDLIVRVLCDGEAVQIRRPARWVKAGGMVRSTGLSGLPVRCLRGMNPGPLSVPALPPWRANTSSAPQAGLAARGAKKR